MWKAGDSFRAAASGTAGITQQSGRILDTGATIRHNRDVGPQKFRQGLVGGGWEASYRSSNTYFGHLALGIWSSEESQRVLFSGIDFVRFLCSQLSASAVV